MGKAELNAWVKKTGRKKYQARIVAQLEKDGDRIGTETKVGRDGVTRTLTQHAIRNGEFLVWKYFSRSAFVADKMRDAHDDAVIERVSLSAPTDMNTLVGLMIDAEVEQTN